MTLEQAIRELVANADDSVTDGELLDMIMEELDNPHDEHRLEGWYLGKHQVSDIIKAYHYNGIDFCATKSRTTIWAKFQEKDFAVLSRNRLPDDPIFDHLLYPLSQLQ